MSIIFDDDGNELDGDAFKWDDHDAVTDAAWSALQHECPVSNRSPEQIAQQVLANHAIQPHWVRTGEQIAILLAEAVKLARP